MFSQTAGLVSPDHRAWPLSLRVLDLSSNVGLSGPLPQAGAGYADLRTIDVSNTSVSGALPASWAAFPSLQRLSATDTRLQCELGFDAAAGAVSVGRGQGRAPCGWPASPTRRALAAVWAILAAAAAPCDWRCTFGTRPLTALPLAAVRVFACYFISALNRSAFPFARPASLRACCPRG